MCILFFSIGQHPKFPFIVASNRDEFFERPTKQAHFWTRDDGTPDDNLANTEIGRDEVHGGTWFAISKTGRFATITNYRPTKDCKKIATPISRGHLVADFVFGSETPESYLSSLSNNANSYEGFNLIVADGTDVWYYSNKSGAPQKLEKGVYGLSNRLLDTPWPKLERGKENFNKFVQERIASDGEIEDHLLINLMRDGTKPPKDQLWDTGLGEEKEILLSSIFVTTPFAYGTRCTSVVSVNSDNHVKCREKTYNEAGNEVEETKFEFDIQKLKPDH